MALVIIETASSVLKRISHAAMRAGRCPSDVKLVAVCKTVDAVRIRSAVSAGIRDFGESRMQEAEVKARELGDLSETIIWHMIGHLQKNKARAAVGLFDLIHSVDSVELASTINRHASDMGKTQGVMIQVKLAPEETKHGMVEEELEEAIGVIVGMENLKVEGLMTIPPYFGNPELSRPYYSRLRELRDRLTDEGFVLPHLSMGMTDDFEVAVEEGSTIVRVGTAIFGERVK